MAKKGKLQEAALAEPADPLASEISPYARMIEPADPVAQTSEPVAIRRDAMRSPDAPDRPRVDALDPITQALGTQYWRSNPVYDWCRQPSGFRHRFTRYYFSVPEAEQKVYVLVDIFALKVASIEKEVAQKAAAISAENERRAQRGEHPVGYLPIVRGATVPYEVFEAVKRGECMPLQVKRDLNEVV